MMVRLFDNTTDICEYISGKTVVLQPGGVYAFESAGNEYKVRLYDEDGVAKSNGSIGGLILYPLSGLGKIMAIKEKPDVSLSALLNISTLIDDILENALFNVNVDKPNMYLETIDDHNLMVWKINNIKD